VLDTCCQQRTKSRSCRTGGTRRSRAIRLLGAAFAEVSPQRPDRAGDWLILVPHVRAVLSVKGWLGGSGERELTECAPHAVQAASSVSPSDQNRWTADRDIRRSARTSLTDHRASDDAD
jgi:hypothetical protein